MSSYLDKIFEAHLEEAFGEKHKEFTVLLRNRLRKFWLLALKTRTGDDMTGHDEDAFLHGVVQKSYPATVGTMSPEWGPSSRRDTSRPACRGCGGRGLGDYPYECTVCGGSGNG
jgi:hypothetical protein